MLTGDRVLMVARTNRWHGHFVGEAAVGGVCVLARAARRRGKAARGATWDPALGARRTGVKG